MSEEYLNMPKYTLISHNKKRSKYLNIRFKYPYAVAYCVYPSIFRHLECSEPEAYSELCQSLRLSMSFRILCNPDSFIHNPVADTPLIG